MDLEQQRQRAWARLKKEFGFCPVPEAIQRIDEFAGPIREEEDLPCYERIAAQYMEVTKLQSAATSFPKPKTPQNPSKERYERPFQKRLHLVYFVIAWQIGPKTQRNKIRKRINWKATCEAWNEAHPYDQKTPKVLKATFHRAIDDGDLQREFKREIGTWVDEALWAGWLSQVIEEEDLIVKWAKLFALREGIYVIMGKPLDDKQQELELEAINNPYNVQERLGETIRKGMAFVRGIDFNELKDLSDAEIREIIKSYLGEAKDER